MINPLTDRVFTLGWIDTNFIRSIEIFPLFFFFLSFFLEEWDNYCRLLRSSPLETRASLGTLDRPGRRLFNVFSLLSFLYGMGCFEWNIDWGLSKLRMELFWRIDNMRWIFNNVVMNNHLMMTILKKELRRRGWNYFIEHN